MARGLITAKLHGVKSLQAVSRAQQTTVTNALSKALERIARDIGALARALVQVKTGRLKRSIRAREIEPKRWQVVAGNRKAFYGHFVERGTFRSRAYPFLRPAFDAYRDKIAERVKKAVLSGLKAGARTRAKGARDG